MSTKSNGGKVVNGGDEPVINSNGDNLKGGSGNRARVDNRFRRSSVREFVANLNQVRGELSRLLTDRRRNIEEECGYTDNINGDTFQILFDWEPVANRAVKVIPEECWLISPKVYEQEEKEKTDWELAVDSLSQSLFSSGPNAGGKSYFSGQEGNPIWEVLSRLDMISGITGCGILVFGVDGETDLKSPLEFKPSDKAYRNLMYLTVYSGSQFSVSQIDGNPLSPRYNQPLYYQIRVDSGSSLNRDQTLSSTFRNGSSTVLGDVEIHWTRVLHIPCVDNLGSSEVYATSRLQPIYRRLIDLQKVYAGAGEGYWQSCLPAYSVGTDPSLGGDADITEDDENQALDSIDKYTNGMSRWLLMNGYIVKPLNTSITDPRQVIDIDLEAICIQIDVPLRIFKGSERGELASSQDDTKWKSKLSSRRKTKVNRWIIIPFFDRLINIGVLPVPKQFFIEWPEDTIPTPEVKSTVALNISRAIAEYVKSDAIQVMPVFDFLTKVIGLEEEEVKTMLDELETLQLQREQMFSDIQSRTQDPLQQSQDNPPDQSQNGDTVDNNTDQLQINHSGQSVHVSNRPIIPGSNITVTQANFVNRG